MVVRKNPKQISYDALTQDVKDVMDRAVRAARKNFWCESFDSIAASVFNVSANDVVDSDGFSCKGYNRQGFNAEGWNRDGFNAEGFNKSGFNAKGFDKEGYDRYGLNKDGVDRKGRDKYRFDSEGFDQDGYDWYGSRRRANRDWYAKQAAKPDADFKFDEAGRPRPRPRTATTETTPPKKVTVARKATTVKATAV